MIYRQFLLFSSIVALLFAQGCASLKQPAPAPASAPPVAKVAKPKPIPHTRPFTRDTLYDLLVAEFAGKRNRPDVALGKYLKQAHETRDPQVVERAAYIARYLGAHQATLDAAMLWIEIEPNNPTPRSLAATELLRFGRIDEAMDQIDKLVQSNADINYEFLLQAIRNSDADTRKRVLERLLGYTKTHDDAKLWFAVGAMESMDGAYDKALKDFDHALTRDPGYANAMLARAQTLIANGQVENALQYLGKQAADYPHNKRLGVAYSRYLIQFGKLQDAQKQFEQLVKTFPDDGDLLLSLALLSWENKLDDDAVRYFKQLVSMGYRTDDAYLYLARIAESKKQYQEAETDYRKIDGGPNFTMAQIQLALMYSDLKRTDDALKTLDEAMSQDKTQTVKYLLAKSEVLSRVHREADAITMLDKGLKQFPNEPALLYSRAMLRETRGDFQGMVKDLQAVLKQQPNNSAALNALGYTYADRNEKLKEAKDLIEKAYKLNPNDPAIIDSMGWIQYRMGEPKAALGYLREAYKAFRDQEIAAHLVEVLWVTGQKDEAEKVGTQALKENPDSTALKKVMQKFAPAQQSTTP